MLTSEFTGTFGSSVAEELYSGMCPLMDSDVRGMFYSSGVDSSPAFSVGDGINFAFFESLED